MDVLVAGTRFLALGRFSMAIQLVLTMDLLVIVNSLLMGRYNLASHRCLISLIVFPEFVTAFALFIK
jgi:hypothetical protein